MRSFNNAERIVIFGNEPSGRGSNQIFKTERTPLSRNSCCNCLLRGRIYNPKWNAILRTTHFQLIMIRALFTMLNPALFTSRSREQIYLLWQYIDKWGKRFQLINRWFWLSIQLCIFFSSHFKPSNELLHKHCNFFMWLFMFLLPRPSRFEHIL